LTTLLDDESTNLLAPLSLDGDARIKKDFPDRLAELLCSNWTRNITLQDFHRKGMLDSVAYSNPSSLCRSLSSKTFVDKRLLVHLLLMWRVVE
jgi:hypothetical protein